MADISIEIKNNAFIVYVEGATGCFRRVFGRHIGEAINVYCTKDSQWDLKVHPINAGENKKEASV